MAHHLFFLIKAVGWRFLLFSVACISDNVRLAWKSYSKEFMSYIEILCFFPDIHRMIVQDPSKAVGIEKYTYSPCTVRYEIPNCFGSC